MNSNDLKIQSSSYLVNLKTEEKWHKEEVKEEREAK